ncbi:unnamed protein product, partial [Rotaria sp. Silwood1]
MNQSPQSASTNTDKTGAGSTGTAAARGNSAKP